MATFVWRKENETDLFPVATKENKLSVLIPVRGFASIPDQNVKAEPGISETVIRLNDYLGGSCLHKTDKEGCPIYIERAVRVNKKVNEWATHVSSVVRDSIGRRNWESMSLGRNSCNSMLAATNSCIVWWWKIAPRRQVDPSAEKLSSLIVLGWGYIVSR